MPATLSRCSDARVASRTTQSNFCMNDEMLDPGVGFFAVVVLLLGLALPGDAAAVFVTVAFASVALAPVMIPVFVLGTGLGRTLGAIFGAGTVNAGVKGAATATTVGSVSDGSVDIAPTAIAKSRLFTFAAA